MKTEEIGKFFNYLGKSAVIFGPKECESESDGKKQIMIEQIDVFGDLAMDKGQPVYSFKKFFVPEKEILFEYQKELLNNREKERRDVVLFGMNLLDLRAVLLYDQVFEKDPYYQARRRHILTIGYSDVPDLENNIFEDLFEEDVLEHLNFDIFFGKLKGKKQEEKEYAVFTGSSFGQKLLDGFGYKEYFHIQFSGPVKEGKPDKRMTILRDKLVNNHNQALWDGLGRRCIECGKCTIACPTCFCFRMDDRAEFGPGADKRGDQTGAYGLRDRCWDSCYYQEFSEVAGGHKFLDTTAKRIHFWYFHKFVRIPEEFDFIGCVGCRRCSRVCPVGIDIAEVLEEVANS